MPKIFFEYDLEFGIAELGSFIIILSLWNRYKTKLIFKTYPYHKDFYFGCALILIIGLVFSVYPDGGFDTFNYHLIAQNPHFTNYFVDDYGYGNFQVWGFRLCDRMFYYFRIAFGYRLGTVLNIIAMLLSFAQVYLILGVIQKNSFDVNKRTFYLNRMFWSLCIVLPLDVLMMMGSYYVDIIMMPIAIYLLRVLLKTIDKNVTLKDIVVFAFLNGLLIAGKLTNIVYVIPFTIVYLIVHRKQFDLSKISLSIIVGMFCYMEYLWANYVYTGNPFFPYYNSIFRSDFFPAYDFKDARWGGTNLFEKIFWLGYLIFRPEYRISEIYDHRNILIVFGVLVFFYLLFCVFKNNFQLCCLELRQYILMCIAISSAIIWGITTGYGRYYVIGRIFWGIISFVGITFICEKKTILTNLLGISLFFSIGISMFGNMIDVWNGREWSWRNKNLKLIGEQLNYILNDRYIVGNTPNKDSMFILTDYMSQGVAELVNPDIYAFNVRYIGYTKQNGDIILREKLDYYKFGYDFHKITFPDICDYIEFLNKHQLVLNDFSQINTPVGRYNLVKLSKLRDQYNRVWTSNDVSSNTIGVKGLKGKKKLSFWAGMSYDWSIPDLEIVIMVKDRVIGRTKLRTSDISKYDIDVIISENIDCLNWGVRNMNNGKFFPQKEANFVFCINWKLL